VCVFVRVCVYICMCVCVCVCVCADDNDVVQDRYNRIAKTLRAIGVTFNAAMSQDMINQRPGVCVCVYVCVCVRVYMHV